MLIEAILERRSDPRFSVALDAQLRRSGRHAERVMVSSVSTRGCAITPTRSVSEGEYVWIRFSGLEARAANVVWIEAERAGLKFIEPLHSAVVDQLSLTGGG